MKSTYKLLTYLFFLCSSILCAETTPNPIESIKPPSKTARPKKEMIPPKFTDPVRFGFKGGVTFTKSEVNFPVDFKTGRGLVSSIALEIPLREHIFFQPELGYSQFRSSFFDAEDGADSQSEADGVELQLLGKFRFVESQEVVKPFLLGGVVSTYIVKSRNIGKNTYDTINSIEKFSIAAALGAGFQFQIASGVDLGVEGRYLLGLNDTLKSSQLSAKSRVWYVGATLFF